MLRLGKVSSVNKEKLTIKVIFEDLDNMISDDLKLMIPFGMTISEEMLPRINENVGCLFIENSTDGFVIGRWKVD